MIQTNTDTIQAIQVASVQEPRSTAKACMIWMHGLGAESTDMEMLVQSLPLSDLPLRHIFINAPIRPVTLNNGMEMRAWYDISPDFSPFTEDAQGILSSAQGINTIIEEQISAGIAPEYIGLAGFSQGGAMALHTCLNFPKVLAGMVALSAYVPLSLMQNKQLPKTQINTPVFIGTGLHDEIVHYEFSKASQLHLENNGFQKIDFHAYPMEHSVSMDEMRDLSAWIRKYFSF